MPLTTLRLHVGQGTHRGPLTFFPIWTDAPAAHRGYITGAAAPVDVAERDGSPVVDQGVVPNRGRLPVLLLGGELLEGGWQTRALTSTTLLAPGKPSVERVFCVEEGRWGGADRSEEHTSELQSRQYLVCRLLLEINNTFLPYVKMVR